MADEASAIDAMTFYVDGDGMDTVTPIPWRSARRGRSCGRLDCDDDNPFSTHVAIDADCDGAITLEDCDDGDAESTIVATDGDCDGALTADDCDDGDPSSTLVSMDGTAMGFSPLGTATTPIRSPLAQRTGTAMGPSPSSTATTAMRARPPSRPTRTAVVVTADDCNDSDPAS